jgi:hypothetical protein
VDAVGNHPAFRARGQVEWSQYGVDPPGWSAALIIDHAKRYRNEEGVPTKRVGAQTTANLLLGYRTPSGSNLVDDLAGEIGINNVRSQNPPFVNQAAGFDQFNANLIGRVVFLSLQKNW